MSDKIRLLPDTVANQIAAGEVVNRPASVVKEMMENAVDAGAQSITVQYRAGGKELIRVIDDGEGMSPIDARLAFDKHATSKITRIEDVYSLHTFGFRGEALASIAAIAHVELVTRQRNEELGTKIIIEGSRFQCQEVCTAPQGSQFSVKNLFYNVPARRRVLEKSTTEHRHIVEEFRRVALCHPEMAFALYGEDAPLYNLQPSNLKQRIVGLIGKGIANNLLEVDTDTSIVRINGFVGRPSASKQTNREQYMFVNGRFFKSPYFHKAVMQAYEKLIPAGTQPSYFLYFELDPEKIDVNIHPQKIEVKFEDGPTVWQILAASVKEALAKTGAVSFMDFDEEKSVEIPVLPHGAGMFREPPASTNTSYNPFKTETAGRRNTADISDFTGMYEGGLSGLPREDALSRFDESVLEYIEGSDAEQGRLIGKDENEDGPFKVHIPLSGGYVATGKRGGLVLIDLRRAKEAILYERYLMMLRSDSSVTQKFLFPEVMVFSTDDITLMRENYDDFTAFGFEFVFRDGNTIEITGIPADFDTADSQSLLYDMIDNIRDELSVPAEARREQLAAVLARDGGNRKTKSFTEGEMTAILESLAGGGRYNYTPDGWPVIREVSLEEIKSFF